MEAVSDVMNKDVTHVPQEKPINVKDMEEVSDVMNKDVMQVLEAKPINV